MNLTGSVIDKKEKYTDNRDNVTGNRSTNRCNITSDPFEHVDDHVRLSFGTEEKTN